MEEGFGRDAHDDHTHSSKHTQLLLRDAEPVQAAEDVGILVALQIQQDLAANVVVVVAWAAWRASWEWECRLRPSTPRHNILSATTHSCIPPAPASFCQSSSACLRLDRRLLAAA